MSERPFAIQEILDQRDWALSRCAALRAEVIERDSRIEALAKVIEQMKAARPPLEI